MKTVNLKHLIALLLALLLMFSMLPAAYAEGGAAPAEETAGEAAQAEEAALIPEALSDSDLTLKDIDKICAACTNVLVGVFHERIEYPNVQIPKKHEEIIENGGNP